MTLTLRRESDFEFFGYPPIGGVDPGAYLRKSTPGGGSPTANWVVEPTSFPEQGLKIGFLDADVAYLLPEKTSSTSQQLGLVCLQSHRELVASFAGHRGYGIKYDNVNGRLYLVKFVAGLRIGVITLQTIQVHNFDIIRPPRRLGLGWIVDPQGQWTLLVAYFGLSPSGLFSEVGRYQDFDSPYIDGVSEGGFYDDGGSGSEFYLGFSRAVLRGTRFGVLVEPSLAQYRASTTLLS